MSEAKKLEVVKAEQGTKEHVQNAADDRLSVKKTYKLYIGGQFPRTESGRYSQYQDSEGQTKANICRASRKDLRNAVQAARKALSGWSGRHAYNRGQILYRIAEMFESRRTQFIDELTLMGLNTQQAEEEVAIAIDRLVYYAGWADKYQQIFSSVNPVSSSHFSFSLLEPVGVVGVCCSDSSPLVELVSLVSAAIVGGNVVVALASEKYPLSSITFAEVLNSSDVPGGVVNILTAQQDELISHMSGHMDVNSLVLATQDEKFIKDAELNAVENLKRIVKTDIENWKSKEAQGPYFILDTQEVKTTWHPLGA